MTTTTSAAYSLDSKEVQEAREFSIPLMSTTFALFPCGHPEDPHAPRSEGWQNTRLDPFLNPRHLPKAYGVLLTANYFVLDVDPTKFRNGVNQLDELWKKLELGPIESFIVTSGRGGAHIYFKKPPGVSLPGKVPGFPAIDIKTHGGYVLGPGSVSGKKTGLVNGGLYYIERGSPRTIKEAPPELLEYLTRDRVIDTSEGVVDDSPATQSRFISFLMRCDASGTYAKACEGRQYGLSEKVVGDLLLEYFNPRRPVQHAEHALREKVRHAFKYGQNNPGSSNPHADFKNYEPTPSEKPRESTTLKAPKYRVFWDTEHTKSGEVYKSTLRNCVNFFFLEPMPDDPNPLYELIRYNEFSCEIEFTRPAPWHTSANPVTAWTDTDTVQLKLWLGRNRVFSSSTQIFHEAVVAVAHMYSYNPPLDWFESLKWDGVKRIDSLLSVYAGAMDNAYTREVSRIIMLAATARIYQPGCKFDYVVVLEGLQDLGKSLFIKTLAGPWFGEFTIDTQNKDTIANMLGCLLIEMAEMDSLKRLTDVSAMKAFITRSTDRFRKPYDKFSSNVPRRSIFLGTINPDGVGYLIDTTGNRRFLPVHVTKMAIGALERDREQLFAEAVYRYKQGENWHIADDRLKRLAKEEQSKRAYTDSWVDAIEDYLESDEAKNQKSFTIHEIAWAALSIVPKRVSKIEEQRISRALTQLGFTKSRGSVNGKQRRSWSRQNARLEGI